MRGAKMFKLSVEFLEHVDEKYLTHLISGVNSKSKGICRKVFMAQMGLEGRDFVMNLKTLLVTFNQYKIPRILNK